MLSRVTSSLKLGRKGGAQIPFDLKVYSLPVISVSAPPWSAELRNKEQRGSRARLTTTKTSISLQSTHRVPNSEANFTETRIRLYNTQVGYQTQKQIPEGLRGKA